VVFSLVLVRAQPPVPRANCSALNHNTTSTLWNTGSYANYAQSVIVVSPVIMSEQPIFNTSLNSIGFYVSRNGFYNGPSNNYIAVYKSNIDGSPGGLIFDIKVDLAQFTPNSWNCIGVHNVRIPVASKTRPIWVGFLNINAQPAYVINRFSTSDPFYRYYYHHGHSIGTPDPFPYGAPREYYQLVMGISLSTCGALQCGACTRNSQCVWCLNTNQCLESNQRFTCHAYTRDFSKCRSCPLFTTCEECTNKGSNHCAWCHEPSGDSTCVQAENDDRCSTVVTQPGQCSAKKRFETI